MPTSPGRGWLPTAALTVAACSAGLDDAGGSTATGDHTSAGPTRSQPVFLTPDEFRLQTTRTAGLDIEVRGVYLGVTQLLVDGTSAGILDDLRGVGQFIADDERVGAGFVSLRFEGAMMPGEHRLQLFTPAEPDARRSDEIVVRLQASGPPVLQVELGPESVASATTIWADGELLLLLDPADATLRALQRPWPEIALTPAVSMPGYAASQATLAVSAVLLDRTLRVVWRVDPDGQRIDLRDADIDGDTASPVTALAATAELTGTVEHATFGRPLVREDVVIAELHAPHDSETRVPGDRMLVSVPVSGTPPTFGLARRIRPSGTPTDVDGLGPALDLSRLALAEPQPFSLRLAGHRAALADLASIPTIRGDAGTLGSARLLGSRAITTLIGAFGSHTAMTRFEDAFEIVQLDTSGSNGSRNITRTNEASLLDVPPTAEPAVGVVAGSGVFLLPYGSDAPVRAVTTGDEKANSQPLAGLFCDAVALAPSRDANDVSGTVDLACLLDGELYLGTLGSGI